MLAWSRSSSQEWILQWGWLCPLAALSFLILETKVCTPPFTWKPHAEVLLSVISVSNLGSPNVQILIYISQPAAELCCTYYCLLDVSLLRVLSERTVFTTIHHMRSSNRVIGYSFQHDLGGSQTSVSGQNLEQNAIRGCAVNKFVISSVHSGAGLFIFGFF